MATCQTNQATHLHCNAAANHFWNTEEEEQKKNTLDAKSAEEEEYKKEKQSSPTEQKVREHWQARISSQPIKDWKKKSGKEGEIISEMMSQEETNIREAYLQSLC